MRALLEDCWDGRVVAMQRNLDRHKDHTHSRISFWTTEFALQWSWALGLCCWLWLQSVLPQHDIELFCPSSDILHIVSVSDELGPSSLVLEGWAILTALLLSGQTPVFLKPDMDRFRLNRFIPSLWEQGIKLKLHNYRPRIVKYVWHTDDQCRLRAPKRLTSRGWVVWVVLGGMQKTITPSWAAPRRASGV